MKNFIIFMLLFNFSFSIEKYKDEDILSVWNVEKGEISLVKHNEFHNLGRLNSLKYHKDLWKIITAFYPKEILSRINEFIVFSDNKSDNMDGMSGLVESVPNTENSRFILSIDISDSYYENGIDLEFFLPLLTHEFFHMVSLNETQLSAKDTGGLRIYEGFTYGNSYINSFYKKFWNNSLGKRLELLDWDPQLSSEKKYLSREELFENHKDQFISPYSMTNPVEDIATSFEQFVRLNKSYLGESLKDKKIRFFYLYPELVKYKSHFIEKKGELMRAKLNSQNDPFPKKY